MTNLTRTQTQFDRAFDALFRRSIGYDYLPDFIENWGTKMPAVGGFPPYDIVKDGENNYTLSIALAGYGPEDVEITLDNNRLFVKTRDDKDTLTDAGAKKESMVEQFLYKGIAKRSFNLSYALGEHMEVKDADFQNGLLSIKIERMIPEELKPRVIPIIGHTQRPALEDVSKAA
jgi:molecular chaperone IbpA